MKTYAMLGMLLLATQPSFAQSLVPPHNEPATNAPASNEPAINKPAINKSEAKPSAPRAATVDARVDQRITQMHQRLKITAEQKPAWDTFAQEMRTNVTTMQEAYKKRSESVASMSAPENMRNFAQIEEDRAAGVQKLAASFQSLYDMMSDSQKKTADAMFSHYGDHKPNHRNASR